MPTLPDSATSVNGKAAREQLEHQVVVERNKPTLEHLLIIGVLRHDSFYRKLKSLGVCPPQTSGAPGYLRPDFKRAEFNVIYRVVSLYREGLINEKIGGDFAIGPETLDLLMLKEVEQGKLAPDAARSISLIAKNPGEEDSPIIRDLKTLEVDRTFIFGLPYTPVFQEWLVQSAIKREVDALSFKTQSGTAHVSLDDVQQAVRRIQQAQSGAFPAIFDATNFMAKQIKAPIELVEGVFHQGGKFSLSGASKSFKSWVLLNLGISVASGEPWLCFKTSKAKVLIVNLEIPEWSVQQRLRAIAQARGITIEPQQLDIWNLRGYAASHDVIIPRILDSVADAAYALIIIDPIYKLYGSIDENSAHGVAQLMNSIESLAVQTGAGVAFGSHYSKGNQAAKDAIDRTSGSGVFARDPDTILTFTKHESEDAFTVEVTVRNFKPIRPFVVRWQYPLMIRDNGLDPKRLKKASGKGSGHDPMELLHVLPDEGLQTEEWRRVAGRELNIKDTAFYKYKDRLEADGLIVQEEKKWKPTSAHPGLEPQKTNRKDPSDSPQQ